jgi:hypothetical protein
MNNNYLINDEVWKELNEVENAASDRGYSVMDFYEKEGYGSPAGMLIEKYGEDVIGKEYVERLKIWYEENDMEYLDVMWK